MSKNYMFVVGFFGGVTRRIRKFIMRQNLPPLELKGSAWPLEISNQSNEFDSGTFGNIPNCATSPDGTKLVVTCGGSNHYSDLSRTPNYNKFFVYTNTEDMYNVSTPQAAFPTTIHTCASSNTHFAIGGDSPFLYLYSWTDLAFININTSGLGSVLGLCFSKDGSKLYVAHKTAPCLRVYNINDLSFTDAPFNVVLDPDSIAISSDGTVLCVTGFTSGSEIRLLDTQNLNLIRSLGFTSNPCRKIRAFQDPTRPKSFYVCKFQTQYQDYTQLPNLCYVDANDTNAFRSFERRPSLYYDNGGVTSVAFDSINRKAYYFEKVKYGIKEIDLINYQIREPLYSDLNEIFWYWSSMCQQSEGLCRIYGTVRDINNNPVQRKVRAFLRSTGELMAETLSDSITGNYQLIVPDNSKYDVIFYSQDNELLNDLIYSKTEPEPYTIPYLP